MKLCTLLLLCACTVRIVYAQLDFNGSPVYSLEGIAAEQSIIEEQDGSMMCDIQGDELTVFFCQINRRNQNRVEYPPEILERLTIVDSRSLFNKQNCLDMCPREPTEGQLMKYEFLCYLPRADPNDFIDL